MTATTARARVDCTCPRARHRHGDLGAYQIDGCRCFRCCLNRSQIRHRHAITGDWREYAWQSAYGVARRLQALSAIGYSDRMIADHTGIHFGHIVRLRLRGVEQVTGPTFERVARCYDQLWSVPYVGPYATRTKRAAARKGWLPPLAWDDDTIDDPEARPAITVPRPPFCKGCRRLSLDEVLVERFMAGTGPDVKHFECRERVEAILRLAARGLSDAEVGKRVRMERDAVAKTRERHGIQTRWAA